MILFDNMRWKVSILFLGALAFAAVEQKPLRSDSLLGDAGKDLILENGRKLHGKFLHITGISSTILSSLSSPNPVRFGLIIHLRRPFRHTP